MLAVSPEERSELQLEEPHTELAERYVDSHLGIEKGCSVVDPHHFHADPDADPTFQPDADPDLDPCYQIKAQSLEKVLIYGRPIFLIF